MGLGPLLQRATADVTPQSLLGLLRGAHSAAGRVRELDFSIKIYYGTGSSPERREQDTIRVAVTFGDSGVPVSVTAPPASEVDFS
jgi:hypothetical protein